MCGVIDPPALFFVECDRDEQEDGAEKEGGKPDRDKEDAHEIHRMDQDICEN